MLGRLIIHPFVIRRKQISQISRRSLCLQIRMTMRILKPKLNLHQNPNQLGRSPDPSPRLIRRVLRLRNPNLLQRAKLKARLKLLQRLKSRMAMLRLVMRMTMGTLPLEASARYVNAILIKHTT